VALCLSANARVAAQDPEDASVLPSTKKFHGSSDLEKVTTWVRQLGYTKFFHRPFITMQTGGASQRENQPWVPAAVHGFLIQGDQSQWSIYTLDLITLEATARTREKNGGINPAIEWRDEDLIAYARKWIDKPWGVKWQRVDKAEPYLDFPSYAVVLATALVEHKQWELAEALLKKARSCRPYHGGKTWPDDIDAFLGFVANDFAATRLTLAMRANSDRSKARGEVRQRLDEVIRLFPQSKTAAEARILVEALGKSKVGPSESKGLAKANELAAKDQVVALILLLETQNGSQNTTPGYCNIFNDSRLENSPAYRLVRMGYPAVPQLMESLDDPRLSRSSTVGSRYTLRVGECVKVVLEAIAKREFSPTPYSMKNGKHEFAKKNIARWWAETEGKSEFDIMAAGVRLGERGAPQQAANLLDQFPEKGLPIIMEVAEKSMNPEVHGQLIVIAARAGLAKSGVFLHKELRQGSLPVARVRAAAVLWGLGEKDAAQDAMVVEWRRRREANFPEDSGELMMNSGKRNLGGAGAFLAETRSVKGIKALAESWLSLPVTVRYKLLKLLTDKERTVFGTRMLTAAPQAQKNDNMTIAGFPGSYYISYDRAAAKELSVNNNAPAIAQQIDAILIKSIGDTARHLSNSMPASTRHRLCDLAAEMLVERHPDRYSFDSKGSWKRRELERTAILNTWHSENGEESLPIPEWKRDGSEKPGLIASIEITSPKKTSSEMVGILDEIRDWKGTVLDKETLSSLTQGLAKKLPPGWDFKLRLAGDHELVTGLDLSVVTGPYDTTDQQDYITEKPEWLWWIFSAEQAGASANFSRMSQIRYYHQSGLLVKPFIKEVKAFEGAVAPVLSSASKKAFTLSVHLRHAVDR